MKGKNLSLTHTMVLTLIIKHEALTLDDINQHLDIQRVKINSALKYLVQWKLIEKEDQFRRANSIFYSATEKGISFIQSIKQAIEQIERLPHQAAGE